MKTRKLLLCAILCSAAPLAGAAAAADDVPSRPAAAQLAGEADAADHPSPGLAAAPHARFEPEFDLLGLGCVVSSRGLRLFSGVDTTLSADLMAVYDVFGYGYFRTPQDAPLETVPAGFDPETSPYAKRLILRGSFELAQGVFWNERRAENLVEVFGALRVRYEENLEDPTTPQLVFASSLPDRLRILQSSVFLGVEARDVDRTNAHHVLSGWAVESSVEWGPQWLFNSALGTADFVRLNCSTRLYIPILDVDPSSRMNVFSTYLAGFLAIDWATGNVVPLNIRESFGGRSPRKGLGYAVRGLEDCRYDAPLKAVANIDLRCSLPAVFSPDVIPGLLACLDGGYYNFLSIPAAGLVFSTGFGVSLSLLDFLSLTLTTHVLLNRMKVTGGTWTPVVFNFVFHF